MATDVICYSVDAWCCSVITACTMETRYAEGIRFTDVDAEVTCPACLVQLKEWREPI